VWRGEGLLKVFMESRGLRTHKAYSRKHRLLKQNFTGPSPSFLEYNASWIPLFFPFIRHVSPQKLEVLQK
jgi:hypothetical protein